MQFQFCKCGVPAPHARLIDEDGLYTRPFFSREGVMRHIAQQMFNAVFSGSRPVRRPDDIRDVLKIFVKRVDRLPPHERRMYDAIMAMISVPELPETEQGAWDAMPEREKKPIRDFCTRGVASVSPMFWPGGFGTEWELRCIQGTNPPNHPVAKCNLVTMLYAPEDCIGSRLRG